MSTPDIRTVLEAVDAAVSRTSGRAVARGVGLSPTRLIEIVEEHRSDRAPTLYEPTLKKLHAWYERTLSGGEPTLPRLTPEVSCELRVMAVRLEDLLDPDLTVLVGPHQVSTRDLAGALRRLGGV